MGLLKHTGVTLRVAGAATLLLTGGRMSAAPGQTPNYWPMKVGSTWTLTTSWSNEQIDLVLTISGVKVEKERAVATLQYTANGDVVQTEKFSVTSQEVIRLCTGTNGAQTASPGMPIIKYPMKAGDSWTWKGSLQTAAGALQGTCTWTVSGPTAVVTPAGTFSAMKVHDDMVVMAQGKKKITTHDTWFAPNVGIVKQHSIFVGSETNAVLKSYKLN